MDTNYSFRSRTGVIGTLGLKLIKPAGYWSTRDRGFWATLALGLPTWSAFLTDPYVFWYRVRNFSNLLRGARRVGLARLFNLNTLYGALFLRVLRQDGTIHDLGLVSLRLVTDNGAGFIVDAWQNTVELETMKFHGVGTGTNAENATDSALQTELTTQYNPDNTRATGSLAEASQKVFRTVGTNAFDASAAVTEHGILSQAATGGGVLFDRSQFAAINVVSGDSIQSTYEATFNSGS